MKPLFLFPAAIISLSLMRLHNFSSAPQPLTTIDSVIIEHQLDGTVKEWPVEKFSSDKDAGIDYAIDNDGQNLYLAMKIPGQGEQMKIMRMGMSFFIDLKGKHKKNQGIEFPIKKDIGGFQGGGMPQRNEQGERPDVKAIRMMLAINLISLKLFGFTDAEPVEQALDMDGSARIAYNWDSTDLMQIEYILPLKMLGDPASLDQKNISIGWKVNGAELPSSGTYTSGISGSKPTSSIGPGGGRPGTGTVNRSGSGQPDMQKMMQEQEIWTKYTFSIPAALKGF
jgi:hypothetical protein